MIQREQSGIENLDSELEVKDNLNDSEIVSETNNGKNLGTQTDLRH